MRPCRKGEKKDKSFVNLHEEKRPQFSAGGFGADLVLPTGLSHSGDQCPGSSDDKKKQTHSESYEFSPCTEETTMRSDFWVEEEREQAANERQVITLSGKR